MYMKSHEGAFVNGFQGPFFPEAIEPLMKMIESSSRNIDRSLLEKVALETHNCLFEGHREKSLRTSDGYVWNYGLTFRISAYHFGRTKGAGRVAILLPWPCIENKCGTRYDRSIAIYTQAIIDKTSERASKYFAEQFLESAIQRLA